MWGKITVPIDDGKKIKTGLAVVQRNTVCAQASLAWVLICPPIT